jgi:RTX calcium-binding nonapeptide repeat (4 copies)/Beta-propeller repeat
VPSLVLPKFVLSGCAFLLVGCSTMGLADSRPEPERGQLPATSGGSQGTFDLTLPFIENRGQVDPSLRYYLQGAAASVGFGTDGVRMALGDETVLGVGFPGARKVAPIGMSATDTVVSYFRGPPSAWKAGLPTFDRVVYRGLWPGIDLAYARGRHALKYEFRVEPGADPEDIGVAYNGVRGLRVDGRGRLVLLAPSGVIIDRAPVAWQLVGGKRRPVDVAFSVVGDSYGFRVGRYNPGRPLVIDPAIVYSGFIGGLDRDNAFDVAVDAAGHAYVVGETNSSATTFPVAAGPDLSENGSEDAFVAKVNPSGTGLVYAGFIGGTLGDIGFGVAADAAGNAYVTGRTNSDESSFPVVGGPETSHDGAQDGFVAKVNSAGTSLVYSGFLGGTADDIGFGIALDGDGNAYVNGVTESDETSFPASVGPDLSHNGGRDAFVAKVNPGGGGLAYAGYIGGSGDEITEANTKIAVDAGGNAYLAGPTDSDESTFPVKGGPDLTFNGGSGDAYVAKVNPQGTALVYAGYIGGVGLDHGIGVAVDGSGRALVGGFTASPETTFPAIGGPDLTFAGGFADGFVARVNPAGTALEYAGYVGGAASDFVTDVAVDPAGRTYLSGATESTEGTFPVVDGPDLTANGIQDAFVAKVEPAGTGFVYSSFLGGTEVEVGWGLAVDHAGNAYIAGNSDSTESSFPVAVGPDPSQNGDTDAFITKVQTTDRCQGRPATLLGSQGKDRLTGTSGADVVLALGGNDRVSTRGGKDRVCAGKKNDTVKGGGGADRLLGEQGKDDLIGGGGKDLCKGGPGKDEGKACEKGKV